MTLFLGRRPGVGGASELAADRFAGAPKLRPTITPGIGWLFASVGFGFAVPMLFAPGRRK